jgi:aspartate racemase
MPNNSLQSTSSKKAPVLGVLGGMGPATTAKLYLQLTRELTIDSTRPRICIWNVGVNEIAERNFIEHGGSREHFLEKLQDGARALERAGCDLIVIPCNTAHLLLAAVQTVVAIPVLNMITLTAQEAHRRNWKSVLLLATSTTIATHLYQQELARLGINVSVLSRSDQTCLDQIILTLIKGEESERAERVLREIIAHSKDRHVILGCTDLQMCLSEDDSTLDSVQALVRVIVRKWKYKSGDPVASP